MTAIDDVTQVKLNELHSYALTCGELAFSIDEHAIALPEETVRALAARMTAHGIERLAVIRPSGQHATDRIDQPQRYLFAKPNRIYERNGARKAALNEGLPLVPA